MFLGMLAGLLAGHIIRQRRRVPVLAVTAGFGCGAAAAADDR
jgi:hypothetical protein